MQIERMLATNKASKQLGRMNLTKNVRKEPSKLHEIYIYGRRKASKQKARKEESKNVKKQIARRYATKRAGKQARNLQEC